MTVFSLWAIVRTVQSANLFLIVVWIKASVLKKKYSYNIVCGKVIIDLIRALLRIYVGSGFV